MSKRDIKEKRWALKKLNRELNIETQGWPFGKWIALRECARVAQPCSGIDLRKIALEVVKFRNNDDFVSFRSITQMRKFGDGRWQYRDGIQGLLGSKRIWNEWREA